MKKLIEDIIKNKIIILFMIFWICIIFISLDYSIAIQRNIEKTNSNTEIIDINTQLINNYEQYMVRLDSMQDIILKNDTLIIIKLEELCKKN